MSGTSVTANFDLASFERVPDRVLERHGVHKLKNNDIVFGRKGAVDRHLLVRPSQEGWMQGSDCIRLGVDSSELCPLLVSFGFREENHKEWMLAQCSNKATMASLNQDVVARIPLLTPVQSLVREFSGLHVRCSPAIGHS